MAADQNVTTCTIAANDLIIVAGEQYTVTSVTVAYSSTNNVNVYTVNTAAHSFTATGDELVLHENPADTTINTWVFSGKENISWQATS